MYIFAQNFQIFYSFFIFLNIFYPFFLKIPRLHLLSRIGPVSVDFAGFNDSRI